MQATWPLSWSPVLKPLYLENEHRPLPLLCNSAKPFGVVHLLQVTTTKALDVVPGGCIVRPYGPDSNGLSPQILIEW